MTAPDRAVVRLSSPGEVAAAVPVLCGFVPHDSLVVLALRERRVLLTMRVDLPPEAVEPLLAGDLADRVGRVGAGRCVVVVLADRPRGRLVDALLGACADAGIEVVEALHVAGGRWTSYTCRRDCCPPEGTPVPEPSPRVLAEHVLTGRAVLPSRADLVASLAPPALPGLARARQARAWGEPVRPDVLDRALRRVRDGGEVDPVTAAEVAVALHDVALRDAVAARGVEEGPALRSLLEQVARAVAPPDDAPVCTVLAWLAAADGDGGSANVALDRALATDPGYRLALLLRTALDAALPPSELRAVLAAVRPSASGAAPRRAAPSGPPPARPS